MVDFSLSGPTAEEYLSSCRLWIPELLDQLSPKRLIEEHFPENFSPTGETFPSHLLSVGKAAEQMSRSLIRQFSIPTEKTLTILPEGYPFPKGLPFVAGNHPYPGASSLNASRKALAFVASVPNDGSLICAISGGTSSLLFHPAPGLPAEKKAELLLTLMSKGAPIDVLNLIRMHLSSIKGGGLLREFKGKKVWTMLLSDTPCLPPETVGSGPTFPLHRNGKEALSILQEWLSPEEIPDVITNCLLSGQSDVALPYSPLTPIILGNSQTVLEKAETLLAPDPIESELLTACLSGEAQEAGRVLGSIIRWNADRHTGPKLFLATGETTVTLTEGFGQGGRTLELGLSLGLSLGQIPAVVGCLATDGLDGNSGLSGILFHTSSLQKEPVRKRVRLSLKKHDTSLFVQTDGFMLKYGPTGTNLNDLVWVYLPQSVQEG
ncbi:MAG: DUF4147 domain-containing protein [Leptospirales bacterium]